MDAAQRYQYDLHGFLHVPEALSADELAAARAAAHAATRAGEPFAVHCTPALAAMPFHPAIWPVVLELTDGKPMMRHSFGIHNSPRQNAEDGGLGGGPLHCNRESHRSSVFGSPNLGTPLSGTAVHDGKPYSTDVVCFVYLDTVNEGDGGLLVIPGSFKSNFERPAELFGSYGRAHAGPPEGIAPVGHARPPMAPGEVPEHCVNLCPQAGDVIFMSEGTSVSISKCGRPPPLAAAGGGGGGGGRAAAATAAAAAMVAESSHARALFLVLVLVLFV